MKKYVKTVLKTNFELPDGIRFDNYYESYVEIQDKSFKSGLGILIKNENGLFVGYDSSFFEQK